MSKARIWLVFTCGVLGLMLSIHQLIRAIMNHTSFIVHIISIVLWFMYIISMYYSIKNKKARLK